ncbi:hypothetical protein [Campylobacter phage CJLB-14]|nr:hypothetical protein [Campylobacter phage CJLB-14]
MNYIEVEPLELLQSLLNLVPFSLSPCFVLRYSKLKISHPK